MSIHYISQAWKTPVADYKAKLVLLKLADNANDDGIAWPHIDTIASETGLSRRGVFRALNQLEEDKLIERNRGRNEVIYKIHKCQADTSTSAKLAPLEVEKCQSDTSRSAKLALALTKEPSIEHIGETTSLTPKFLKAQQFIDYYESKGWVVGKAPMKCWKAAVRTWQARDKQTTKPQTSDQFGI